MVRDLSRLLVLVLLAALALSLGRADGAAAGSIVYDNNGYVAFMNDDGTGGGLIGPGSDPSVNPEGDTVVFTGDTLGASCNTAIMTWRVGTATGAVTPIATDFADCAVGPEAGIGGRYLFGIQTSSGADSRVRQGSLSASGSTELPLCQALKPSSPWERVVQHPGDPSPNPVRNEWVFTGCQYHRCPDWPTCGLAEFDDYSMLTLIRESGAEEFLLGSLAYLEEPSWSPDGEQIGFIQTRKVSPPDPDDGIWVANTDRTGTPRHVFALTPTDLSGHLYSPRFTGDGRIIFDYENVVSGPNGIFSIPASCSDCTLANAAFLGPGHDPAWTAATIRALPATATPPSTGTSTGTSGASTGPSTGPSAAPLLSALRVSPRTFELTGRRVGGRCAPTTRANRGRSHCTRPIALRVSYTLDVAARITLTIERTTAGRKVGGRCVTATRANRKRPHCTRWSALGGTLVHDGAAGAGQFTFNGRIGGRTLQTGDYRLAATPSVTGLSGTSQTAAFRIRR